MQQGDAPGASQLDRIEAKLDRLNGSLDTLASLEGVLATVGDGFDDLVDRVPGGPAGLDDRLRRTLRIVERLSRPAVLETLEQAVVVLEGLPGLVATAGDTFEDLVARGKGRGIDPERIGAAVLGSDMLRTENIELVARVVGELGKAADVPTPPVGVVSLIMTLREPEVQRTLGFVLQFARRLGAVLDDLEGPVRLPAGDGV